MLELPARRLRHLLLRRLHEVRSLHVRRVVGLLRRSAAALLVLQNGMIERFVNLRRRLEIAWLIQVVLRLGNLVIEKLFAIIEMSCAET